MRALYVLLLATALAVAPVCAQQGPSGGSAGVAAEAAQFEFLVGEWEMEITPKASGLAAMVHGAPKRLGSWKAWRVWDGRGYEDELRVFDAAGNLLTLVHALRVFDSTNRRWAVHTLDVPQARLSSSLGTREGSDMLLLSVPGSAGVDGKPHLLRTRFFDISADRFRLRQDRSADNGQSWDNGVLTIVAKRVANKAVR